jgi:hypothetical protein
MADTISGLLLLLRRSRKSQPRNKKIIVSTSLSALNNKSACLWEKLWWAMIIAGPRKFRILICINIKRRLLLKSYVTGCSMLFPRMLIPNGWDLQKILSYTMQCRVQSCPFQQDSSAMSFRICPLFFIHKSICLDFTFSHTFSVVVSCTLIRTFTLTMTFSPVQIVCWNGTLSLPNFLVQFIWKKAMLTAVNRKETYQQQLMAPASKPYCMPCANWKKLLSRVAFVRIMDRHQELVHYIITLKKSHKCRTVPAFVKLN